MEDLESRTCLRTENSREVAKVRNFRKIQCYFGALCGFHEFSSLLMVYLWYQLSLGLTANKIRTRLFNFFAARGGAATF